MNQLITTTELTTTQPESEVDKFCGQCGQEVAARDNFCRRCGSTCHETASGEIVQAYVVAAPSTRDLPLAPNPTLQSIKTALNNRWLVIAIVALIGPLGLPALWFSPRFKPWIKVTVTAVYVLLTAVVPVVVSWYIMKESFHPLVEVFGPSR